MKVVIKILKIILGIVLGLVFSFVTIVCLEVLLPKPNPFRKEGLNLWLTAPIIAGWLFLMLWVVLRKPSAKKIHTQGIELLPESIGELIDGIIDAMRYRWSVRADVRQELADHFTDALADCETEEEKQTVTKELIAEFGDIELLGKLLRRAKKRCRPLWRTIVARTFQLMGLCVVLLILYIGWFFTGKPQITTNYLEIMNQQVRPVADDNQNAWPFYKQATKQYVKYERPTDEDQWVDFSPRPISKLSEQDRQIIQQSIDNNQKSLDLIHQGNRKPFYWPIYGTHEDGNKELIYLITPNLNEYSKLTELICWQGLFNAEQGDFAKAFDDIFEGYSFGCLLRKQSISLIEQLVAMSVEGVSRETLLIVLAEYGEQIDVKVLNSIRKRFEDILANKNFTLTFSGEKLFMLDEIQRSFTHSRLGRSHLYPKRISHMKEMYSVFDEEEILSNWFHVIFMHPDKKQTLKDVDLFYEEMVRIAKMTPASAYSQKLDMGQFSDKLFKDNFFLSIMLSPFNNLYRLSYRVEAQAYGTLVIMAVMQYEKGHGQLPESLDVLVDKGLLKEVPRDPFSDKPLVYRRTDDDFILYSVGLNFTDDGGELGTNQKGKTYSWRENGDGILWPVDR